MPEEIAVTLTAEPAEQDLATGHLDFLVDQAAPYCGRVTRLLASTRHGLTPAQRAEARQHIMRRCLRLMVAAIGEPGATADAGSADRADWSKSLSCRLAAETGVVPADEERDALLMMAAIRVLAFKK